MAFDYFSAYGKPHPNPFVFGLPVQSLEGAEYSTPVLFLKSYSVVFHKNPVRAVPDFSIHLHEWRFVLPAELDGVANEIPKELRI